MIKRNKIWKSISAATLVGATGAALTGCDSQPTDTTDLKPAVEVVAPAEEATHNQHMMSSSGGEGEGEGEGADAEVDLGTDDIAYLTQLALMRGHLFVGHELYKAGHIEHAKTHMKHPESELYADVAPAFDARGSNGFAEELSAIADAVEAELGDEAVATAYINLTDAIAQNEVAVSDASTSVGKRLKLVSEILRVAGEEYAIAVVDGQMQNAHEYQDAFGFTTISTAIVNGIKPNTEEETAAKQASLKILNELAPHWPTLVPPETLETNASDIYAAAAKIELQSLGLD